MTVKPRHRSEYTDEETRQVHSACLTMAVTLGAYLDDLCVVGGVVPTLLIDHQAESRAEDERYAEIAARLRQEGFEPDVIKLSGHTFKGEAVTRSIPICGPAAFIVLKALAFGDRGEPKDAYDLIYVLRATRGVPDTIADRLADHASTHTDLVSRSLALLERDFGDPTSIGPQRAADFEVLDRAQRSIAAADAHGHIDDLLNACRDRGIHTDGS